jgi:hypothetical protein
MEEQKPRIFAAKTSLQTSKQYLLDGLNSVLGSKTT